MQMREPSEATKITYGILFPLWVGGIVVSFLFGPEWIGPELVATALVFSIAYELKR